MNHLNILNISSHILAQVQEDAHFINFWDTMYALLDTQLSAEVWDKTRLGTLLATHDNGIECTTDKIHEMIYDTVNEQP